MKFHKRHVLRWTRGVCVALLTACTSPGYNDNPSQQISNPRLGCPAGTDFFTVYFSVHVQPSAEIQDARVPGDRFRAFCNHIPLPGRVFLTVDLVGPELTRTPIGLRVVEPDSEGRGEFQPVPPIFETPARIYSKGVLEASFELVRSGEYAVYLSRGGNGPVTGDDQLVIPLHVGLDSAVNNLAKEILAPLAAVLALALAAYLSNRYLRRRKSG